MKVLGNSSAIFCLTLTIMRSGVVGLPFSDRFSRQLVNRGEPHPTT